MRKGTTKLTESKHLEGNDYSLNKGSNTLIHWGWLKSDQTCTQANMLAAVPLTKARDRHWCNHCHSLGSPDVWTSFFIRQLKKGALDLPCMPGFDCDWLKIVIVTEVIVFSAVCNLSFHCCSACLSSAYEQRCSQMSHPILGLDLCTRGSKLIHQAFFYPLSSSKTMGD